VNNELRKRKNLEALGIGQGGVSGINTPHGGGVSGITPHGPSRCMFWRHRQSYSISCAGWELWMLQTACLHPLDTIFGAYTRTDIAFTQENSEAELARKRRFKETLSQGPTIPVSTPLPQLMASHAPGIKHWSSVP